MSVLTTFVDPLRKPNPLLTRMLIAGAGECLGRTQLHDTRGHDVALDGVVSFRERVN